MVDTVSGETVSYLYDSLKRLTAASSTAISGGTPAAWTQTFNYDGFGNLTAKSLNGTTTPIAVTAATNRLAYSSYDANGNMLTGVGATLTYDERNRLATATPMSGGTAYYGYAPDNKRIYQKTATGIEEWCVYDPRGERVGTFSVVTSGYYPSDAGFGSGADECMVCREAGKPLQRGDVYDERGAAGPAGVGPQQRGAVLSVRGRDHLDRERYGQVRDVLPGFVHHAGLCGAEVLCEQLRKVQYG